MRPGIRFSALVNSVVIDQLPWVVIDVYSVALVGFFYFLFFKLASQ